MKNILKPEIVMTFIKYVLNTTIFFLTSFLVHTPLNFIKLYLPDYAAVALFIMLLCAAQRTLKYTSKYMRTIRDYGDFRLVMIVLEGMALSVSLAFIMLLYHKSTLLIFENSVVENFCVNQPYQADKVNKYIAILNSNWACVSFVMSYIVSYINDDSKKVAALVQKLSYQCDSNTQISDSFKDALLSTDDIPFKDALLSTENAIVFYLVTIGFYLLRYSSFRQCNNGAKVALFIWFTVFQGSNARYD